MRRTYANLWGLFFIGAAILLIVSQFTPLKFDGGQFFGTVLLAVIFIWSIVNLSIAGTVYSLAFLIIINAATLKIGFISPWVILSIALLLQIGLTILLAPWRWQWPMRRHRHGRRQTTGLGAESRGTTASSFMHDSGIVDIKAHLMNCVRYLKNVDLRRVKVSAFMSGVKLYLENTELENDVVIDINSEMSNIELYVPTGYPIVNQLGFVGGNLNLPREEPVTYTDGVQIILQGNVNLGNINCHYV